LIDHEDPKALWFDFCGQFKLFKRFPTSDSARPTNAMVDTIDEMNGLERLVVFGVGLDEDISGNAALSNKHRSRIYRVITRAHLVYYLINKHVKGGWSLSTSGVLNIPNLTWKKRRRKLSWMRQESQSIQLQRTTWIMTTKNYVDNDDKKLEEAGVESINEEPMEPDNFLAHSSVWNYICPKQ